MLLQGRMPFLMDCYYVLMYTSFFDTGYLTITNQHKTEVSKRIKEEFENGKEYYQFHGKSLLYLPEEITNRPKAEFIQWHNENVYKG